MFIELRKRMAVFIAPEFIRSLESCAEKAQSQAENARIEVREANEKASQRVAQIVASIDPYELILERFRGIFSKEYERPEENLSARDALGMMQWGHQQFNDPHFKFLMEWIMNTQGNATLQAKNLNRDNAFDIMIYGRAQISTVKLFIREVGRLASLYEEQLAKQKEEFNSEVTAE